MSIKELEECMNVYGTDVYAFCRQLTHNRQESEDLYQDTFLKAMEMLDRIDGEGNPKSYLISIALRIWKNRKRKYAWRNRIADIRSYVEEADESEDTGWPPTIEEDLILQEEREELRRAVGKLDERYKLPVLLHYMEDFSIDEVARMLGIPAGTVKSRLYTARTLLKKDLEVFISEA